MSPPSTPIRAYHVRPKTANTPTQSRRVLTAPAINDGLKTGRDAVMSDLGPAVRRVPLTYFLSKLLPQLGYNFEEQLDAIQADLESKGAITNGRWSAFSIDPQDSKEQEDPTFKDFETIVNAVVKSALEVEGTSATDGDQTTKFVWNPNCAPLCALRGTKSRPDGYWQFIVPTFPGIASDPDHVYWEDIVVPGEKKKRRTYEDLNDVGGRTSLNSFLLTLFAHSLSRTSGSLCGPSTRPCAILPDAASCSDTPSRTAPCISGFVAGRT